jgi:hypothetical protein
MNSATHTVDLIDFRELLKKLSGLPVFRDAPVSVRRGVRLNITRSSKPRYIRGTAFSRSRRLRLVVGPWVHAAHVLEYFLHELVHLALPPGTHHNARFRMTLARAAREAWGVLVDPHVERGSRQNAAYAVDDAIFAALVPLIETEQVIIPRPQPRPPAPTKRQQLAAVVTARAEHAFTMHARAKSRLARARTLERKWREKVRYYERKAAKGGPP